MAVADGVLQRTSPGKVDGRDGSGEGVAEGSSELHVLAVDDSHVDRKVIEKILKRLSCKVTAVDSARRALQFLGLDGENSSNGLEELKVNLIMTDYSMPGMTGYELLKKIKESAALREIPVVIMSSERVLARINRCLQEGAEEFLSKPVQFSDVKRLRDYMMRGGEVCNDRTALKRLRGEDEDGSPVVDSRSSSPATRHDRSGRFQSSVSDSIPPQVAVISPKRLKVQTRD